MEAIATSGHKTPATVLSATSDSCGSPAAVPRLARRSLHAPRQDLLLFGGGGGGMGGAGGGAASLRVSAHTHSYPRVRPVPVTCSAAGARVRRKRRCPSVVEAYMNDGMCASNATSEIRPAAQLGSAHSRAKAGDPGCARSNTSTRSADASARLRADRATVRRVVSPVGREVEPPDGSARLTSPSDQATSTLARARGLAAGRCFAVPSPTPAREGSSATIPTGGAAATGAGLAPGLPPLGSAAPAAAPVPAGSVAAAPAAASARSAARREESSAPPHHSRVSCSRLRRSGSGSSAHSACHSRCGDGTGRTERIERAGSVGLNASAAAGAGSRTGGVRGRPDESSTSRLPLVPATPTNFGPASGWLGVGRWSREFEMAMAPISSLPSSCMASTGVSCREESRSWLKSTAPLASDRATGSAAARTAESPLAVVGGVRLLVVGGGRALFADEPTEASSEASRTSCSRTAAFSARTS
eukprot:scaffold322_cov109-Isochrysis_galbana.AAC.6